MSNPAAVNNITAIPVPNAAQPSLPVTRQQHHCYPGTERGPALAACYRQYKRTDSETDSQRGAVQTDQPATVMPSGELQQPGFADHEQAVDTGAEQQPQRKPEPHVTPGTNREKQQRGDQRAGERHPPRTETPRDPRYKGRSYDDAKWRHGGIQANHGAGHALPFENDRKQWVGEPQRHGKYGSDADDGADDEGSRVADAACHFSPRRPGERLLSCATITPVCG
jgi:hypothetical protein